MIPKSPLTRVGAVIAAATALAEIVRETFPGAGDVAAAMVRWVRDTIRSLSNSVTNANNLFLLLEQRDWNAMANLPEAIVEMIKVIFANAEDPVKATTELLIQMVLTYNPLTGQYVDLQHLKEFVYTHPQWYSGCNFTPIWPHYVRKPHQFKDMPLPTPPTTPQLPIDNGMGESKGEDDEQVYFDDMKHMGQPDEKVDPNGYTLDLNSAGTALILHRPDGELLEVPAVRYDSEVEMQQLEEKIPEIAKNIQDTDQEAKDSGWNQAPQDALENRLREAAMGYGSLIRSDPVAGTRRYYRPGAGAARQARITAQQNEGWVRLMRRAWLRVHGFAFDANPNWARSALERIQMARINIAASIWRQLTWRLLEWAAKYAVATGLLKPVLGLDPYIPIVPDIPTNPTEPQPPHVVAHSDLTKLFLEHGNPVAVLRTNEEEEVLHGLLWPQIFESARTTSYSRQCEAVVGVFNTIVNWTPYRTIAYATEGMPTVNQVAKNFYTVGLPETIVSSKLALNSYRHSEMINGTPTVVFRVADSLALYFWEIFSQRQYLTLRHGFASPSQATSYLDASSAQHQAYTEYAKKLNPPFATFSSAFQLWETLCNDWAQAPGLNQGALVSDPSQQLEKAMQTHCETFWDDQVKNTIELDYAVKQWQVKSLKAYTWFNPTPYYCVGIGEQAHSPLAYLVFLINVMHLVMAVGQIAPTVDDSNLPATSVVDTDCLVDRMWWKLVYQLEHLQTQPAPINTQLNAATRDKKPLTAEGETPGIPTEEPSSWIQAWTEALSEVHTMAQQAVADERKITALGRRCVLDLGYCLADTDKGNTLQHFKSIEEWKTFWDSKITEAETTPVIPKPEPVPVNPGQDGDDTTQNRAYDEMSRPRLIYGEYWGDSKTHNPIKNTQGKFATEAEAKKVDPQAHKHVPGQYGVAGFDGENPAYQLPDYLKTIPLKPLFAEDNDANQLRQYLALTPLTDIPPWVRGVPGVNQFLDALQKGNAFGISETPNDYGLSPQQMIQQAQGRGDNLKVDETQVKALMDQVNMTYTPKQWQHNNLWTVDHRGPITELQLQRAREDLLNRKLAVIREQALLEQEIAMTGLHTAMELTPQQEAVVNSQLGKRYDKPWKGAFYQNKLNEFHDAFPNKHLDESYPQIGNWPSHQPGPYSALHVVDSERQRRQHQTEEQARDERLKSQLFQMMLGHSLSD